MSNPPPLRWLLMLLLLLMSNPLRAQVVALDPVIQGQALGAYLQLWVDGTGEAGLTQVLAESSWQRVGSDVPNFGFNNQVHWFRLDLQTADVHEPWLLEIAYNLLDEVQLYLLDSRNRVVSVQTVGMLHPERGPARFNRMLLLPLPIEKAGLYTAYLRVRSDHAVQLPLYLWRSSDYIAHAERDNIALGIFFGTFFILLLYNFFLYTLSREPQYLSYVGLALTLIFFHAQLRGLGLRLWFPQWVQWNGPLTLVASLLAAFMLGVHADRFLQLDKTRFPLAKLFILLRWLCLVTGGIILWSRAAWALDLMVTIIALTSVVTIYAVLYCYQANDRPLRWFAAAWVMFFLGIIALAGNKLGILPFNVLTEHAVSLAALFGMMMISMAMSDRASLAIRRSVLQLAQAQRQYDQSIEQESYRLRNLELARAAAANGLRLQTENNARLQRELAAREQQIDSLAQQLKAVSRVDPLSHHFNRSYFNQRLKEEYERAVRAQQRLSLILVGIADLDAVQQEQGFRACDEVVKQVADALPGATLEHCAQVYRFGDSVFAVLVPGISLDSCQGIAERIRAVFTRQTFEYAGRRLQISIGVGVGSLIPDGKQRPELLVDAAEQAMLQACEQHKGVG